MSTINNFKWHELAVNCIDRDIQLDQIVYESKNNISKMIDSGCILGENERSKKLKKVWRLVGDKERSFD